MSNDIILSKEAFVKMVMHAYKYPERAIVGVLLCSASTPSNTTLDQKEGKKKERHTLVLTDTLPLFHNPPLAPLLEVALLQADEHCRLTGRTLCGVYFANEMLTDSALNTIAIRIATKIKNFFPQAFIVQLDNAKLSSFTVKSMFRTYRAEANTSTSRASLRWVSVSDSTADGSGSGCVASPDCAVELLNIIRGDTSKTDTTSKTFSTIPTHLSETAAKLTDFEDHLNNASKSWLNHDFVRLIST